MADALSGTATGWLVCMMYVCRFVRIATSYLPLSGHAASRTRVFFSPTMHACAVRVRESTFSVTYRWLAGVSIYQVRIGRDSFPRIVRRGRDQTAHRASAVSSYSLAQIVRGPSPSEPLYLGRHRLMLHCAAVRVVSETGLLAIKPCVSSGAGQWTSQEQTIRSGTLVTTRYSETDFLLTRLSSTMCHVCPNVGTAEAYSQRSHGRRGPDTARMHDAKDATEYPGARPWTERLAAPTGGHRAVFCVVALPAAYGRLHPWLRAGLAPRGDKYSSMYGV